MPLKNQLISIVPKKYRGATEILEYVDLEDFEAKIRKLNEQTSAAFFIEALAIYGILYDGELYSASNLTWKQYKSETGKRLGLHKRDFSDFFNAGKFLALYGKQLFASGFDPMRSQRKLARANAALKICGDIDKVIDHLINDQWEDFKAWYTGMKLTAIEGPTKRKRKRSIVIADGKVIIDGIAPVRFAKTLPDDERTEIEALIAKYYKAKAGK